MSLSSEDLSNCSLEEILKSDAENRAWSKQLRIRISALVNSRLSHQISLAEYTVCRTQVNEEAAECKRRRWILSGEIENRRVRLRSAPPAGSNAPLTP
jgi:hypothetical protein